MPTSEPNEKNTATRTSGGFSWLRFALKLLLWLFGLAAAGAIALALTIAVALAMAYPNLPDERFPM